MTNKNESTAGTVLYADVIVGLRSSQGDKIYTYRVPEAEASVISEGMIVTVPFGSGSRRRRGYVVGLKNQTEYPPDRIRNIERIPLEEPVFGPFQLEIARWMQQYYDAPLSTCLSLWVPKTIGSKPRKRKTAQEEKAAPVQPDLKLNEGQTRACQAVQAALDENRHEVFLLHGITGSGKTEVYIRLIEQVLARGRQAIVLVPEIGLTPQLIDVFEKRFQEHVGVTHSRLSDAERAAFWRKAKAGEFRVVIGPRSALFTPLSRIGIILLDEEHEGTYKSELSPRYHAREVAIEMGRRLKIPVVLGSATPSVESYTKARAGAYTWLRLTERAVPGAQLPKVSIVDMRLEMMTGNMSVFCSDLIQALEDRLEKQEQSILFLNRKGYSTHISCRKCGFVLNCPRCYLPYTWHKERGRLICHHCGKEVYPVETCPSCGSRYLKNLGVGTERVEEQLKERFPTARVLRMDTSVIRGEETYQEIYQRFRDHEADILIGTQIVAKGFDFPLVTLVGVLAADMMLYSDDFHSTERTYQLLTQVAGRAGRAARRGEVIVQTYSPDHYSIRDAAEHQEEAFYHSELVARKMIGCPPFMHICQFLLTDRDEETVRKHAADFHQLLMHYGRNRDFQILNPAPASLERVNDVFRYRILVKYKERERLLAFGKYCRERYLGEHPKAKIQMDIDPMYMQ